MKLRKLGGLALGAMLVAAACKTGGGATATPGAATEGPTQAPAEVTPPTDPLGVVTIAPGDPIHIANWGVLSTADATLGQDALYGVQIAIDDKGGKLLDHTIQLTTEDGLCTVEGGATAAQKMAADSTLVGLIGSSCSDETIGGIKALSEAGLTTISPSNTRPLLTDPGRDATFAGYLRTAHSDAFQGKAVAEFAYNELGLKTAATIHDGSGYAEALQQVFVDEFKRLGGTITAQEAVGKTDTDMKPVLTRVAQTKPEMIYYPIFVASGGFITAQARQVPGLETTVLMGSDGIFTPDFVKAAGPAALNMYLSSPNFSAFQAGYADFITKYKAKVGTAPISAFHAHAYDATNILFAAIEKVAVKAADGTLYIPKGALRDAIYATQAFPGITGTLTCGPYGDCGAPLIAVYQITAREIGGEWPPAAPVWP
ncbi:MAG: branched-chain amino acid ABC transporter substrate-binding protein [Chloroflexi bacterium CSP1-4]|nr:MAG: branched-chain amino acid ABC transporter substrate-binding protein [Chloroflexi bacterium CSP1-4]